MIFRFVVRRLGWLRTVPLLPQIFDTFLLVKTALVDRERLRAMEMFEREALSEPSVRLGIHRFGGVGFFVNATELCHLHGNGLFDAHVGMDNRRNLVAAGTALPHHVLTASGWISFWVENCEDVKTALEIMELARVFTAERV